MRNVSAIAPRYNFQLSGRSEAAPRAGGDLPSRAAIVAMWVEAMKAYPGIMFEAWPGSIEVDGDHATMRSYTSEVYDQDGVTKRDRGVYEDVCVKVGGRWLFMSRSFRNIHRQ